MPEHLIFLLPLFCDITWKISHLRPLISKKIKPIYNFNAIFYGIIYKFLSYFEYLNKKIFRISVTPLISRFLAWIFRHYVGFHGYLKSIQLYFAHLIKMFVFSIEFHQLFNINLMEFLYFFISWLLIFRILPANKPLTHNRSHLNSRREEQPPFPPIYNPRYFNHIQHQPQPQKSIQRPHRFMLIHN